LVHELVSQTGEFEFEQPRDVQIKGIEGPQRVYPVAWSLQPSS
jgi:hypothetical protein